MTQDKDKPQGLGEKYIVWEIDKGEVQEEVHGFQDGSCRALTAGLERKLGRVAKQTMKQHGNQKQRTGK